MEGFFNTHSDEPKPQMPEVKGLGITPGNPFAPFVIATLVISLAAIIVLLALVLFAGSIDTRYTAGLILMFVGALAPIPTAILAIYSRNYVRIQRIMAGDHWAHWQYTIETRYGNEVYLSQYGVYWPERRKLVDFKSGLTEIEQTKDDLIFRIKNIRRSHYSSFTEYKEEFVSIPAGKQDEAADMVKRFKAQIGMPSEFMNDSWKIAWAMGGIIIVAVIASIILVLPLESLKSQIKSDAWSTEYAITREAESAILLRGLEPIQRVIMPQLAQLKAAGKREYQPEELGFKPADNINHVVTGFCGTSESFYVLVWQKTPVIEGYGMDIPVYHYVDGEWLESCMPALYVADGLKTVTEDWNYVFLQPNRAAIATVFALEMNKTAMPTAEP